MVKISELTVGQGNVDVEGTIKEIGEKRTFSKFGRELTVANAVLSDDSGDIKLSLWNEDAKRFNEGDKIKITNGYVNEFQGEKQLTSGKFGNIEKIGEGEVSEKAEPAEEPEAGQASLEEANEAEAKEETGEAVEPLGNAEEAEETEEEKAVKEVEAEESAEPAKESEEEKQEDY